jgi:phosphoribosylformylglycinamidine cyclo-ligase
LHTNGYSLARKVLAGLDWLAPNPTLRQSIGDALLAPHRSYLEDVQVLWEAAVDVRGLAHITGGGLIDNPPRIFPADLGAVLHRGRWPIPPLFDLIQQTGSISDDEMAHVFNMGLGMLVIVPPDHVAAALDVLSYEAFTVGEMVAGAKQVFITQ